MSTSSCSCCSGRKNYIINKGVCCLMSNHGRPISITPEIMDEINENKCKLVETLHFFNQPLVINSRKRKREESDYSIIGFLNSYTNNFFGYKIIVFF